MRASSILMIVCAWVALGAWPAGAQDKGLASLLSGVEHPLTVKLKDLGPDWRRVSIQAGGLVRDNISVNVSGNTGGSTSQNNLTGMLSGSRAYLTKGETVAAGGQTYLVAYHLPGSAFDLGTLLQAMATKTPPTGAVLSEATTLPLSLLNLQTIGSLEDVRAFDLALEVSESERAVRALAELFKAQSGGASTNASPPAADSAK